MKTPKELLDYVIHATEKRERRSIFQLAVLSILGGMSIAFGSVGNIIVSADFINVNPGFAKLLGATVFPVGLILIVLLGFELFTSNCLMSVSYVERKLTLSKMLKILLVVWFFNLIGSLIISYITFETETLNSHGIELLSHMAEHKINTGAYDLILKGILCNVLVCGASLLGYICKNGVSKMLGIWFPIMLFIVLGYDHVVANMLYLPLALLHGATGVNLLGIIYNFFFVSIGNFIGGGLVIGLSYWYANNE